MYVTKQPQKQWQIEPDDFCDAFGVHWAEVGTDGVCKHAIGCIAVKQGIAAGFSVTIGALRNLAGCGPWQYHNPANTYVIKSSNSPLYLWLFCDIYVPWSRYA